MAYEVIIDGQYVEMEGGANVPITRQINNVAEMANRQGDYSARLRAVLSDNNRKIFGFTDNPNSETDKAYQTPSAKVRGSGGPIIEDGIARVLSVSDSIEFVINGPGFTLWKDLEGLTLHDIDWTDLDFVFNATNVGNFATANSGFIFPVVDYYGYAAIGGNLDLRYTPGAIFVRTIVDRILSERGYTAAGAVIDDPFYKSLLIPFSGKTWQHSDRYAAERSIDKSLYQSQSFADFSNVSQTDKTAAQVTFLDGNVFSSVDANTIDVSVSYNVSSFSKNTGAGNNLDIKLAIRQNGVVVASDIIAASGPGSFSATITLQPGDTLDMYVLGDYTITAGIASYQVIFDTINFYTTEIDRTINIGDTLTAESVLPEMNQKSFLKGIMQLFGLIPIVDETTKTVTFRYVSELYDNIPNAVDWSDKVVKPPGRMHYYLTKETRLGQYGQTNYFEWTADETLTDPNYGRGQIEVGDTSLEKEYTVFTLPWAASESVSVTVNEQRIARIPLFTDDGAGGYNQTEEPSPRIIYLDRPGVAFTYTDGTNISSIGANVAPWGKFVDPANTENLSMSNNMIARYYRSLQLMLDKSKRFTVLMKLTATDVAGFDFFTPRYIKQLGGVFYIDQIPNFIEGQLTEVPVVRL